MDRKPGALWSMGSQRSWTANLVTKQQIHIEVGIVGFKYSKYKYYRSYYFQIGIIYYLCKQQIKSNTLIQIMD